MSSLYAEPISYPDTRKDNVTDTYHGVKVEDPYRWLEDDNSAETKAWVTAQNEVTGKYLSSIPSRSEIRERLKELWNYERFGLPQEEGGKWFYSRNSGLQDQAVLYTADNPDGERRVLIDPNGFSKDGTVSLSQYEASEDGKLIAYATSGGGSDWNEIRVREVATRKDLGDHLKWVKFSGISWAKDGSGFYYSRYPEASSETALTQVNENQKVYFHRLGEPQEKDALIYERPDQPRWGMGGWISEDGEYLLIHLSQGTDPKNRFAYRSATDKDAKVIDLLPDGDAQYRFIGNIGPVFYFHTDLDAPRKRVIAIDTRKPSRSDWKEIIPETGDLLDTVRMVGGKLLCIYMKDASDRLFRFDTDGSNKTEVKIPGIGSIGGLGGKQKDEEVFYAFTSFTQPAAVYKLHIASGESTLWKKPDVDFDGSAYETKQVFFTSKDGTRVPMFITHKKDIKLDGSHRTLMYGYGGFQISLQPGFSIPRAVWLERGGIAVTVNLRGGGEYGREWHEGGRKLNKQNVFDDFIAAAEKLIADGYTKPANIAIQGGSNGGLLVGACITQRPDLFGAALPAVGVMDMLRFQKFTIGWAWEKDYGSSENPEEFKLLHRYSPYHALKSGTRYPATLVTTADHDDRVVPAHSFKFAARIQECQTKDGPPVLIRIDTSAGHGAGTALSKVIDRTADEWAFLEASLGK
jgi:prolyl oligopeptidase